MMNMKPRPLFGVFGLLVCLGAALGFFGRTGTYDAETVVDICRYINVRYTDRGVRRAQGVMWRMVYGRGLSGVEVRAVLRPFLEHPDVRMRYYAAKYLFEAGSADGRQVLISIMKSSSPVLNEKDDLRYDAAWCLINSRDVESLNDLLAFRIEGRGNPFLNVLFSRFGDVVGPQNAIAAKAELLGLDVQGLNGPPVSVNADKLRERALFLLNEESSGDYDKDVAAWVLALEDGNPQALARLVESGLKEIANVRPRYGDRGEVLKMLGTIDRPESRAVLVAGLREPNKAGVCAMNLLFCQSKGYEPVRQMVLDELRPGKSKNNVLQHDSLWTLVSLLKDDPDVRAAALAADKRWGLGDWEHYVEQRGDWSVYDRSSWGVYWYRRTKVERK